MIEDVTQVLSSLEELNQTVPFYENRGFYGTEQYHQTTLSRRFLATDGVKHVFEEHKCFWVGDVIMSYLPKLDKHESWFFCGYVFVENGKALFVVDDGNYFAVLNQKIEYTDLKVNLKFFLAKEDGRYVCMLPTEY
jgi:hypothetical protein